MKKLMTLAFILISVSCFAQDPDWRCHARIFNKHENVSTAFIPVNVCNAKITPVVLSSTSKVRIEVEVSDFDTIQLSFINPSNNEVLGYAETAISANEFSGTVAIKNNIVWATCENWSIFK